LLPTGWTGAKNSMRIPAHEAAYAGHYAITFDYTNEGWTTPIEQNVEDLLAVHDAVDKAIRLRAIGLSMGGRVLTQALGEGTRIETATAVASAGYVLGGISLMAGARGVVETGRETVGMAVRRPGQTARLGIAGIKRCIQRKVAVGAEMFDLMDPDSTVHGIIEILKDGENPPYLRFMYGKDDKLLRELAQVTGIAGLRFDSVEGYRGGHLRLVEDPELARSIIEADDNLPLSRSGLHHAPNLAAA
jgi:hypothetical protein